MGKVKSIGAILTVAVACIAIYYQDKGDIAELTSNLKYQINEYLNLNESPNNEDDKEETEGATLKAPSEPVPYSKKYSIYDPVGHYNAKNAMDKRFLALQEFCHSYSDVMRPEISITEYIPPKDGFQFFDVSQIPFCTIPKVASKHFRILNDRLRGLDDVHQLRQVSFNTNWPRSMNDKRRAIMVRHPMERLISAYRFAFEAHYNPTSKEHKEASLSWEDFVELAVHGSKQWAEYQSRNKNSKDSMAINTGLIDGKGLSMHWNPYWRQCGLCHPDFMPHYILHMDHFYDDLKVLLEVMDNPESGKKFLTQSHNTTAGHSSMPELIQHYYSQLSKETIHEIYQKYRVDHELFGFKPDYFLQFGSD